MRRARGVGFAGQVCAFLIGCAVLLATHAAAQVAVFGWGKNSNGQIFPPPNLTNIAAISAGDYHSLALQSNGTVVVWGDGWFGQTNVPPGLSNVIAIAAGGYHNLALKSNGTVPTW